jgi:hypothetical protein
VKANGFDAGVVFDYPEIDGVIVVVVFHRPKGHIDLLDHPGAQCYDLRESHGEESGKFQSRTFNHGNIKLVKS